MSFTTNLFLTVFLPIIFVVVWVFRKKIKCQNVFLLLVNIVILLFYGIGGIVLVVGMCFFDWGIIKLIQT